MLRCCDWVEPLGDVGCVPLRAGVQIHPAASAAGGHGGGGHGGAGQGQPRGVRATHRPRRPLAPFSLPPLPSGAAPRPCKHRPQPRNSNTMCSSAQQPSSSTQASAGAQGGGLFWTRSALCTCLFFCKAAGFLKSVIGLLWQAVLQGTPQPFVLPVEELRAAVAGADAEGTREPSVAAQGSDPASATPSLARSTPPVSRHAPGPRPAPLTCALCIAAAELCNTAAACASPHSSDE